MAVNFNNGYNPYQYGYPMDLGYQQPIQNFIPQQPQQIVPRPQTQPRQISTLNGRFVKSADDISPGEIAMDGTVSLFPCEDGSEIYAKCWDSNGSITTTKYVIDGTPEVKNSFSMEEFQKETNNRLDRIEELVKSLCS